MEIVYKILTNKLFIFLVLSLFILVYRLPFFGVPLDRDEGGYAYLGWVWISGQGIPYLSIFDHKPPLVFLIYGLVNLLGNNSFLAIRIFSLLYFLAISYTFYFFALRLTNKLSAFLSTAVLIVYLSSIRLQGSGFNTEMLYILPVLVFTNLVWKMKNSYHDNYILSFLSGILAASAFLFKPTALLPLVMIMFWFFISKKNVKEILLIGGGFVLPILIFLGYFYQQHAIPKLIQDLVFYNQRYNQAGLSLPSLYLRGGEQSIWGLINWLKILPQPIIPFFLFSLVSLSLNYKKKSDLWWISLISIVSAWIAAKLGGSREFVHYYLPLVVGLCFSLLLFINQLVYRKKLYLSIGVSLLLIWLIVKTDFPSWRAGPLVILREEYGTEGDWAYDALKVSSWVTNNIKKDDSFLVWANEPEIYFYSKRISPSEYANFYGFFYLPGEKEKWIESLKNSPPRWIITYINDPASFKELDIFFKQVKGYTKKDTIGTYIIFER